MRFSVLLLSTFVLGSVLAEAPAGFDCKMRHLAMEFAQKLQPFRGKSTFERIAAELNLPGGDPGGATQCFNVTYDGPDREFLPNFPTPAGVAFFVDAVHGSDANPGTLTQPFRSISVALTASHAVTSAGNPASINLRGGTHYLTTTLALDADDSLLTIQNYDGEVAVVSGARRLTTAWQARGKNIYVTDVSGQVAQPITGLRRNQQRGT
jgi:hypothetical protein